MNIIKNFIILSLASISFILTGCTDKKTAAQIEDLKKEIASMKEENDAAKKRQLADSKTLQLSQDRIGELSQLSQMHDNGSRALSQRIDSLITMLPLSELASWKNAGLVECRQLTIKEESSESVATLKPTSIRLNNSTNSYVYIGAVGEVQGVFVKSESGYMATLSASKNESDLSTVSPNESYTRIFSTQDSGGFKSALKDDEKQNVVLMRQTEKNRGFLYINDSKNTVIAGSDGLFINKGDQAVFKIETAKRGAKMFFFDDVGDTAKIALGLKDDNGEPAIAVQGATKFDVLYPTIDRSK